MMILRKPYAFFIKNFKLFHIVMEILILICVSKTKNLLNFLNNYINTTINVIGQNLASVYITTGFILLPIFIILISAIILMVLIVKKKPIVFYISNIAIYIAQLIVILISNSLLISMSIKTIDIRRIMLIRDFNLLLFLIEVVVAFVVFVRAIGFDIKKFDFKTDLKKIDIDEEDREEFEVSLEFDKNNIIRDIRKKIRYFKYSYKENRLLFIILGAISMVSILSIGLIYSKNVEIVYKQDKLFEGDNFNVQIIDSYLVNTNYRGNLIEPDYYYLILQANIKNNTNYEFGLDIASTKLLIGDFVYTPTTTNKASFFDFGDIYHGENIKNEYEKKVFVYQIPKELIKSEMVFSFGDKSNSNDYYNGDSKIKMKIEYKDLSGIDSIISTNLNSELQFTDSIVNEYKIKINAVDVQKQYKLKYKFCIKSECYDSYEYLNPSINSNYDKALLKISGTLDEGKQNLSEIENLYDFIKSFGTLTYTINGEKKYQNVSFKEVKSKKVKTNNTYYLEVNEEVLKASDISIIFTIRNKKYEYILK